MIRYFIDQALSASQNGNHGKLYRSFFGYKEDGDVNMVDDRTGWSGVILHGVPSLSLESGRIRKLNVIHCHAPQRLKMEIFFAARPIPSLSVEDSGIQPDAGDRFHGRDL